MRAAQEVPPIKNLRAAACSHRFSGARHRSLGASVCVGEILLGRPASLCLNWVGFSARVLAVVGASPSQLYNSPRARRFGDAWCMPTPAGDSDVQDTAWTDLAWSAQAVTLSPGSPSCPRHLFAVVVVDKDFGVFMSKPRAVADLLPCQFIHARAFLPTAKRDLSVS